MTPSLSVLEGLPGLLTTPPVVVAGAVGALVVGITGSVHCLLMCGPLACASMGPHRSRTAVLGWHLGRVSAYVLVGVALGVLGRGGGERESDIAMLRMAMAPGGASAGRAGERSAESARRSSGEKELASTVAAGGGRGEGEVRI